MAINPLTAFVGRITAADADYPYGSSKNETTAGAGDGTPYEKIRADDIFGFQQSVLDEAGIVPSGDAETVPDSQYKEGLRIINNMRNTTHNMASDANYTLTATQNRFRRITITDTGVVLTAARDIIVDDSERRFIAINSTAQELTFRTLSGTGIAVAAGESADLVCDGTDVVEAPGAGGLEISSTAQAQAGTDDTTAISPLKLREGLNAAGSAPIYAARTWAFFDGTGTLSIFGSGNISSITDNGVGDYSPNYISNIQDVNYGVYCTATRNDGIVPSRAGLRGAPTVSNCRVRSVTSTDSSEDSPYFSFAVIR